MSYPGRLLVVFVSFVLASGALAQARLDLRIEPPNAELKRNVEGHVGSLDADDEEQLQRLSRVVEAQARRAGEALGVIARTVADIQGMNLQIASAAEEQSSVAEEINRSVVQVREIADQSAAASEQTASSSTELARLGNELQLQVGRFRL